MEEVTSSNLVCSTTSRNEHVAKHDCVLAKARYDGLAMNSMIVYSNSSIGSNDYKDRNYGGYLRFRLN